MTMAPDDGPIDEAFDAYEVHAHRFVEALALGQVADEIYAEECRRRGIPPDDFLLRSPIESLTAPGGGRVRH